MGWGGGGGGGGEGILYNHKSHIHLTIMGTHFVCDLGFRLHVDGLSSSLAAKHIPSFLSKKYRQVFIVNQIKPPCVTKLEAAGGHVAQHHGHSHSQSRVETEQSQRVLILPQGIVVILFLEAHIAFLLDLLRQAICFLCRHLTNHYFAQILLPSVTKSLDNYTYFNN